MSRSRLTLVIVGLIVALAADSVPSYGQPPGRGGRGGRGGGGRGGDTGGGAPGAQGDRKEMTIPLSGLIALAQNDYVQEELKITDTQKQSLKKLMDDQQTRGRDAFQRLRQQTDQATTQAAQNAQAMALQQEMAAMANAANNQQQAYGGNNLAGQFGGYGSYGYSNYGMNQNPVDPAAMQQAAAMQGRMAAGAVQSQSWQMMRQALSRMEQESDQAVLRLLNEPQKKRIREIQLQVEGAGSVLRDEVVQKIQLEEDQAAEIQQTLRETGQKKREIERLASQSLRGITPSAGGDNARGNRRGPGQATPSTTADDAALKKALAKSDVKAKVEEAKKALVQAREREYNQVYKSMDRRQVSTYRKMLGTKPFDVDAMSNPVFRALAHLKSEESKDKAKTDSTKDDAADDGAKSTTEKASKSTSPSSRSSQKSKRPAGQAGSSEPSSSN